MLRSKQSSRFFSGVLAVGVLLCGRSWASNPYLEVPASSEMEHSPAYQYANATDEQVRNWIAERELPFAEITTKVPGVRLPGRLTGPLRGVWVHGTDPTNSELLPYEILDGRLALALDNFCGLLAEAEVVELLHFTIFRPSPSAKDNNTGLTRHSGALAIDVGAIKLANGTWLRVKRDWSPAPGAKTCGTGQRKLESEFGQKWQSLVCEARSRGVFHYALTPHFDAPHADHLHLEIKPNVKWFLYN